MVEVELVPALVGGFAGTVAMTLVMMAGRSSGMTSMDMPLIIGGMISRDDATARRLGSAVHVMMGTVVFGIAYAVLFAALDSDSAVTGLLIGLAHGVAFGLVGLPMVGAIHPRMKAQAAEVRLEAPGVMGVHYGMGTPVGLVMTHGVYGLVLALVYGAFA